MKSIPSVAIFCAGVFCMLIALCMQTVTLTSGRYGAVLIAAIAWTTVADLCFILVFARGGIVWRIAAMVMMLPTIFVVSDFLRRMPGAF